MNRRALLIGAPAVLALAGAGGFAAYWHRGPLPEGARTLTPPEAHAAAEAGEIWLVDIRRPEEWQATGIAPSAIPLDMRREDFAAALQDATAADPDRPVAVICARGVRSRRLTIRLAEAGIGGLLDVPEGMLGSSDGPGWLDRGLPVTTDIAPPA